jgi:hypothetical protein
MTEEDSFIAVIETRSPAKISNMETLIEKDTYDEVVEDITSPTGVTSLSPQKSPRIEDSVEAIDALEEAIEEIEEIGSSLPQVREEIKTPEETRKPASSSSQKSVSNTKRISSKPTPKTVPKNLQPNVKKPLNPSSAKNSTSASKTTATATSSSTGSQTKPATKPRARVSSVSKAPFVPAKSSKPPTRSSFTLPGEAVSARLKSQQEERLKKEEQERKEKREFKARPIPTTRPSIAPVGPRPTIASQKRQSIAKGELTIAKRPTPAKPVVKPVSKPTPRASSITAKQKPATVVSKPVTKPITSRSASTATSRARLEISDKSPATGRSVSTPVASKGPIKSTPKTAATRAPIEKTTKVMTDKEKAEAAKKARAEAAERGRQASREWAERKRKDLARKSMPPSTAKSTAEAKDNTEQAEVKPDVSQETTITVTE